MCNPEIDEYIEIGSRIAEIEGIISTLNMMATFYLGKTGGCAQEFSDIQGITSKIRSTIEANMFEHIPGTDKSYAHVFHGPLMERKQSLGDHQGSNDWVCDTCGCKLCDRNVVPNEFTNRCIDCFLDKYTYVGDEVRP